MPPLRGQRHRTGRIDGRFAPDSPDLPRCRRLALDGLRHKALLHIGQQESIPGIGAPLEPTNCVRTLCTLCLVEAIASRLEATATNNKKLLQ